MGPAGGNSIGSQRRALFGTLVVCVLLAVAFAALSFVLPGCADPVAKALELENQGDIDGALAVYQQALAKDADDTEALSGAAVDLLLLGRYDDALALQERLVALESSDVQTRVELGFNYLNHQGRPADAARVLREAVEIERTAKNLSFLAQALVAAGNPAEGERILREAIEMEPGYGHSYWILVKLLESQDKTDEAEAIVEQASLHGVTVTDLP